MTSSSILFPHVGLYIHIPFCRSKCSYCDFNSFSGIEQLMPAYVEAIKRELAGWSTLNRHSKLPSLARGRGGRLEVRTIYLGGGTPTLLHSDLIAAILSECRTAFQIAGDIEVTVEANPGTVDEAQLQGLLAAGVNRLSFGAQSFQPRLLKLLGRTHSSKDTVEAYKMAYSAGFRNISLDLMYGIPTQSLEEWRADLARAIDLGPVHLSLYGLSVEEGTPLSFKIARGLLNSPDSDLAADMYVWAEETLAKHGYGHYEISNWAMSDARCKHNLTYWRNLPYIGIGAGAHSSFCSVRVSNNPDPAGYIAQMRAAPRQLTEEELLGQFPAAARRLCAVEHVLEIDQATQMAETMILSLRLSDGLDRNDFLERFGASPEEVYGEQIEELCGLGLLARKGDGIVLTRRGMLLGNEVFVRFLSD